ncbi:MAG: TetR/AcrR family transcriptional regulator [Oceanipulchritudo sp.]
MGKIKHPGAKERILMAALTLFADGGYHGTTVDAIVARANINKRMVYYYFGNKEKLYEAVVTEAYTRLEKLEEATVVDNLDTEEWVRGIVATYFRFLRENPEFNKLILWENLNKGQGITIVKTRINKLPVLKRLDTVIREGVAKGQLRPDLDARHLLVSLIGLCQVYFANRYTLTQMLGMNMGSAEVLDAGMAHVSRLLLEGILSR